MFQREVFRRERKLRGVVHVDAVARELFACHVVDHGIDLGERPRAARECGLRPERRAPLRRFTKKARHLGGADGSRHCSWREDDAFRKQKHIHRHEEQLRPPEQRVPGQDPTQSALNTSGLMRASPFSGPSATCEIRRSSQARTSASTRPGCAPRKQSPPQRTALGAPLLRLVDKPDTMVYHEDIRGFVGLGVT
jgi:hypothetical protein